MTIVIIAVLALIALIEFIVIGSVQRDRIDTQIVVRETRDELDAAQRELHVAEGTIRGQDRLIKKLRTAAEQQIAVDPIVQEAAVELASWIKEETAAKTQEPSTRRKRR